MTEGEALVDVARSLFDRGLTPGTSGNVSVRLDAGFLITPTSSCLGRLEIDDLALLDSDGTPVSGGMPSKEWPLHLAIYQQRLEIRAVVHLHSPFATAVSCLADIDVDDALPAYTGYHAMRVGRVPLVAYHPPGSPDLARAVAARASDAHALLLANHGSLVAAPDLEAAADGAEQLEQTAHILLLLHSRPTTLVDVAIGKP